MESEKVMDCIRLYIYVYICEGDLETREMFNENLAVAEASARHIYI